jgi:hypothetical protein
MRRSIRPPPPVVGSYHRIPGADTHYAASGPTGSAGVGSYHRIPGADAHFAPDPANFAKAIGCHRFGAESSP